MKKEDLFDVLGEIKEEKVAAAEKSMSSANKKHGKIIKICGMAACVCIVFLAVWGIGLRKNERPNESTLTNGNSFYQNEEDSATVNSNVNSKTTKRATENVIGSTENGITGQKTTESTNQTNPNTTVDTGAEQSTQQAVSTTIHGEIFYETDWNKKSTPGKYRAFTLDGREYVYPFKDTEEHATERKGTIVVSDKRIEASDANDKIHSNIVDIYSLEGFDENLALGVRFNNDEKIYPYVSVTFVPKTLGEFLRAIDYENTVYYGNIELFSGAQFPVNAANKADIKKYLFSDIDVKNNLSVNPTGYKVTMSISCSELGFENKALYIYEDGHIATNLIGYKYVFFVGKENVSDFIKMSYNVTFEELKKVNVTSASKNSADSATTQVSMPQVLE